MRTHYDRSPLPPKTSVSLSTWGAVAQLSCLVLTGTACLACGRVTDTVAIDMLRGASGSAADGGFGGGGAGADGGSAGGPTTAGQCGNTYPQLPWPTTAGDTVCTSSLARDRMSHALCSCGDVSTWGGVRTDAFDSIAQTEAPGAAAVGINGAYLSPSPMFGGGSVTVAATTDLAIPLLDVRGDLRLAGALDVAGPLVVKRDAWFAESVTALSVVTIGGNVRQVPGKTLAEAVLLGTSGEVIAEEFSVVPPCRCEENQILDWSSIIESASEENDNAAIGLTTAALLQPADAITLTLPCGRYYVSGISSTQDIHLRVVGRVALFVAGDVSATAPLRLELDPGAELDWFIGGKLDLASTLELGEAARPAATRVYVAGEGELSVSSDSVSANLYAPRANVALDGESDFYGSVFGRTISSVGDIAVHYDVAVQRAADGCALDEPASCSGCGQCSAGRACVAGSCAACTADTDCCWPLVCDGGRCTAFAE